MNLEEVTGHKMTKDGWGGNGKVKKTERVEVHGKAEEGIEEWRVGGRE